jgi:hypothetical protein
MNMLSAALAHFCHAGQSDVTDERKFVWITSYVIKAKIILIMLTHDISKFSARRPDDEN